MPINTFSLFSPHFGISNSSKRLLDAARPHKTTGNNHGACPTRKLQSSVWKAASLKGAVEAKGQLAPSKSLEENVNAATFDDESIKVPQTRHPNFDRLSSNVTGPTQPAGVSNRTQTMLQITWKTFTAVLESMDSGKSKVGSRFNAGRMNVRYRLFTADYTFGAES
ncbi:hypothetical protein BT96DRAFT_976128 [Gymnopus androsaceus JB14]|uniref:Uncharacterized protein n=1 Tax=Gymnopus androsaceus JB14 TaxID=1447944 RepID=A0A6A4HPJ7_9AGAR|nr:hypothetical protein BT96DRAFT_976128 [Gymnopus androsaceus JB14]